MLPVGSSYVAFDFNPVSIRMMIEFCSGKHLRMVLFVVIFFTIGKYRGQRENRSSVLMRHFYARAEWKDDHCYKMAASYGRVIVGGRRDMGFGYRPLCGVIAFAGLLTWQVFLLLNIWAKVDDARRAIVALKDFCTGFDRCSAQLGLISIISTCTKKNRASVTTLTSYSMQTPLPDGLPKNSNTNLSRKLLLFKPIPIAWWPA